MGLDRFYDFLVGGEAAKTGFDATIGDVFFDLGEEVMGDFGRDGIGFEGGWRHIFNWSAVFFTCQPRHPPLQRPQG
jgi:hypothetical protein